MRNPIFFSEKVPCFFLVTVFSCSLLLFFVAYLLPKKKVTPNVPATTGSSNLDPKGLPEMANRTSWWLNQPNWKISNWSISPGRVENQKCLKPPTSLKGWERIQGRILHLCRFYSCWIRTKYFCMIASSFFGSTWRLWTGRRKSKVRQISSAQVRWLANCSLPKLIDDTVDGSEIRLTSWYGKYPIIYRVSYVPGGLAGCLPQKYLSIPHDFEARPKFSLIHLGWDFCLSSRQRKSFGTVMSCSKIGQPFTHWPLWPWFVGTPFGRVGVMQFWNCSMFSSFKP